MDYILFDSWSGIFQVVITTILAYGCVVLILRISGKRTLAKMNAFDFIVTIALGSVLASVIVSKSIPLAEGLVAIATLILLQFCLTYFTVRNKSFKKIISSTPTLLFFKGEIYEDILKKERVAIDEIYKSVREAGQSGFENIQAIVLETTGDITIITNWEDKENTAMIDVNKKIEF